jgi:glycine oxidase
MRYLVVGGGLMGCAVALELARRGRRVTVLERAVPGAEASSAAAGILAPRVEAHGQDLPRRYGIRSLGLYPGWVQSLEESTGLSCGLWPSGLYRVVGDGEDPAESRPDDDAVWVTDLPHSFSHVPGAWWLPDEGSVEPPRLVVAVRQAAERAGVHFVTGVPVRRVGADGVELDGGGDLSGKPILCAGAWTGKVEGIPTLPIHPVRGQVMELRAEPGRLAHVVFCKGGYLVPRKDGRVLVGATMEEVGFERGVTPKGLAYLAEVVRQGAPWLVDAPMTRSWSNFRPASPDGQPMLGEVEGVYVVSGHHRNGILLAPLTAQVVAGALMEGLPVPEGWELARFLPAA